MKKKLSQFLILCCLILLISCQKDEYLDDEGLHDAQLNISKVEFLERNSWQLFDTLVLMIDHYNMRDEVNDAPTFFAATDYSFAGLGSLDSIYKKMPADTLRDYIFTEKIKVDDLKRSEPKSLKSASGKTFQIFIRTDNDFFIGERWSSVEPDFLYLTKIVGTVDPIGVDPSTLPLNERDIDVRAQTTGIIDPNGNMLHVLNNMHRFGFN